MKVERLDIVDWEPCTLTFVFDPKAAVFESVRSFVDTWLKERQAAGICGCSYRYSEYSEQRDDAALTLRVEWACEDCTQALTDSVKKKFNSLRNVRLGLQGTAPAKDDSLFIHVEQKEVEFEDGRRELVEPFLLARRPVTVGEFENLVTDTGFVTFAEQEEDGQTFRHNCKLSGLRESERRKVPATFVAPAEAEVYCRHLRCRLPTEAEWLAAAVLQWEELDLTPSEQLRRQMLPPPANAILSYGWDITSTRWAGNIVARRGPLYYLRKDWRTERRTNSSRRLMGMNDFDISVGFRLAKDLSPK